MLRSLLRFVLFIPLFVSSDISSNHGVEGAINTPSAYITDEGELKLALYRGQPDRKLMLTANPFEWMQATLFYVDITNREYGGGFNQTYKDKGFNLKINLLKEGYLPALSVGLNDLAGTGIYNSEYIVLSKTHNKISYSLGLGWGDLSSGFTIKNPLIYFKKSFSERGELIKDLGGTPNPQVYFRGEKSAIFGSLIYKKNQKLSYLVEIDPTVTDKPEVIRYSEKKSKFSFGAYYKFNDLIHLKSSIERGSEITFSAIFNNKFKDFRSNEPYASTDKLQGNDRYQNLQRILELNNIGLSSVEENKEKIRMSIKQNTFNNTSISYQFAYQALKESKINEQERDVEIVQTFLGMEVNSASFDSDISNVFSNYEPVNLKENLNTSYEVIEKFPIINSSISIAPRFFLASREAFFHQGLFLNNDSEILFSENLIISSNLRYSLYDNFDNLYIEAVDSYPAVVRSDVKKYLNGMSDGVTIGRFQLDYFAQKKYNFFQFTAGILEDMYVGAILDYLYFPQNNIFGLGLEMNYARKRDYKGKFGLQNYSNNYSRVKLVLREPKNNIITTFSWGEYLAGDKGYTVELNKRFNNGVKFGVFFSKTDVSPELFGEGSFDKGIKLSIPFGFGNKKSLTRFEWRPLTKDPAALLIRKNTLENLIERYRN